MIVPRHRLVNSTLRQPRLLSCVLIAVLDHDPDGLEGIGDDGALRWANDVFLPPEDQHSQADAKHAEAEQVRRPEADVLLHVWCPEEGKRAHVDAGVEDHIDALDGDGWVEDDSLTSRQCRDLPWKSATSAHLTLCLPIAL